MPSNDETDRATQSPGTSGSNWKAPFDTAMITAFLASLYVIGFVVANVHFWRLEAPTGQFLQERYLGAAVLYLFFTAGPFAMGFGLMRRFQAQSNPQGEVIRVIGATVATGVALWVVFSLSLAAIYVQRPTSSLAPYVGTLAVIGICLGWNPPRDTQARWYFELRAGLRAARSYYAATVASALLSMSALFGSSIYPYILPAYGGGVLRSGRVMLRDTTRLPLEVRQALDRRVILVDRTDQDTNLLVCPSTGGVPKLLPLTLQSGDVSAIALDTVVVVANLDSRVCVAPATLGHLRGPNEPKTETAHAPSTPNQTSASGSPP